MNDLSPGDLVKVTLHGDSRLLRGIYLGPVEGGVDRSERRMFAIDQGSADGWILVMETNVRHVVPAPRERILCAAVWINDGQKRADHPVRTGVVVSGHRHHKILEAIKAIYPAYETMRALGSLTQGFLTSKNRFVGREEARKVAARAGQTSKKSGELYSEDLY